MPNPLLPVVGAL